MKKYSSLLLVLIALLLTACNDFLDKEPNKSSNVVPTKVEHFDVLLNSYRSFASEANRDVIHASDDYGLYTELFDNKDIYGVNIVQFATWDVEYLPDYERPYWPHEWEKIFVANMIISNLDIMEGTQEEISLLEAEAHYVRAYSYYQLANTYCLPYSNENMQEMGLPIKQTTSFEESAERATLEETWALIVSDLGKALELQRKLKFDDDKYRIWRGSTPAVNAFAARVYLCMHDYKNAKKYAEAALADHGVLVDYNTEMSYSSFVEEVTVDGEDVRIDYPITFDGGMYSQNSMAWKELYYYRYLYNGTEYFIPSKDLLALYDQTHDLRYKYHVVEDYSYTRGMVDPPLSYPSYVFCENGYLPSGPTVAEMLLIKAEAQVRQGEWEQGLVTANQLRAKRISSDAPADVINLSAANKNEALQCIIDERRREMPFTQRFFDVRRYNNNDDASDDVVMTREFYPYNLSAIHDKEEPVTYILDKKSRKFARPITTYDITVSEGVIKQNTY
ncbi:RagB/SusD family nutrient uptake outer membrane protein [Carboxylicivirga sp. A043]|uniref:RagB/SusD family nutrient uptake outer membrane protein n=1 Tax=Carboxylicivirga litoralis TaxID=2816963 RepID=UPI0021CB6F9A|nr:RagB/SusD family nutrient uptake outer membrane protein [Carboxylicivirga sp. A043]MCU4154551.1 RagB/SusD family nutrient uptake outer membrane protein [Carboxylicivirga sp. A043]